ncbi:MAG: hypothetical protein CBD88_07150 [Flavobacteriales bacterium TMED228]|nr:MAG: hypothetical protein CBD88_07150 [Flavobacteriales bacterium TMED228]|tara:strand:+ start:2421 stop:2744 length:324 start_codon:yes stop_codon:yes gene_type:complete
MVLQVQVYGTKTTDGTEQTLGTSTYVGVHIVTVDLSAMQAGDTVVLKAKTKTLTGSAVAIFIEQTFTGVQTEPIIQTEPVTSPFSFTATLQRTGGSDRAYPWSINTV